MSDSMERDKNESLAAKEMEEEEEEMKRELLDMGMYESGYTYKEMKDILGFISESKNMANMASDSKNVQKESHSSSECTTEPMPKTNLARELETQEHSDTPRSTHSYRSNHTSPILDRISTHETSSPETMPTIFESRSSTHRRKSSDSDDVFDNPIVRDTCSHSTNRYVSLRTRNTLQESHNAHNAEMKMDAQSEQNQKLDRWRINPLDSCVNENDVPLRQCDRPVAQDREPFRSCRDAQSPEVLDKVLIALNLHLKQMADLWHSWHLATDNKFQWGSPIQVGTANGSLDRKPVTSTKTDLSKTECLGKYAQERASKRKFLPVASPNPIQSSDDEDEEAELFTVKRKKTQLCDRLNKVVRSDKQERVDDNVISSSQTKDEDVPAERNTVSETGTRTRSLRTINRRQHEDESSRAEANPVYPRRIVPPNPMRTTSDSKNKKLNISEEKTAMRKSHSDQSAITVGSERRSNNLKEDEILMELDKDRDDDDIKVTSKIQIKPLPLKNLSVRLERGCALLKKYQMQEQKKKEMDQEEARKKEEEEKRKMEEKLKRRVEELQQKRRRKEEIQKLEEEKSTKWNNVLHVKSKENKERMRTVREQEDLRLSEIEEDRHSRNVTVSESRQQENTEESLTDSITCPICNKPFPSDRIEAHAAACEQYNEDNEEESSVINLFHSKGGGTRRNIKEVNIFECNVCSKFKTDNGIDYEDHVNSCIQRKQREEQSQSHGCTSVGISNFPTSPIRCFRPISEQSDSGIDYAGQFASNSKTQTHRNRKRKR